MKRAPGDPLPKLPNQGRFAGHRLPFGNKGESGAILRKILGAVRKSRVEEDWGGPRRAASKDSKRLNHAHQRGVLIGTAVSFDYEDKN